MKPEDDSSIRNKTFTFIGGIAATIVASYLFYLFTNKQPELRYEIISATSFQTQSSALSIVNIRISNTGNKEATNINGLVEMNIKGKILETNTFLSSKAIEFSYVKDSVNRVKFSSPLLNQSEYVTIAFLVNDNTIRDNIRIYLRGSGIIGSEMRANESKERIPLFLYVSTFLMLFMLLGLYFYVFFFKEK